MERLVREVVPRYTGASGKRLRLGAQSTSSFAANCVKAIASMLLSCELAMSVPRSARTCGGKDTSLRRSGPRNALEAWSELTAPYDGCIRLENLAPSIHNGKIAAQKVFPDWPLSALK
jgi:hypothetical protein